MTEEALKDISSRALSVVQSDVSDNDKMLMIVQLFIEGQREMISWQKGERDKINGFYKEYTKPLYELINLTRERMDKLEDSHVELCVALKDMSDNQKDSNRELAYMVKCVDSAILETKQDKIRYAELERAQDRRIETVEKDLIEIKTKTNTNWSNFGKVSTAIIGIFTLLAAIIFGILQSIKP